MGILIWKKACSGTIIKAIIMIIANNYNNSNTNNNNNDKNNDNKNSKDNYNKDNTRK